MLRRPWRQSRIHRSVCPFLIHDTILIGRCRRKMGDPASCLMHLVKVMKELFSDSMHIGNIPLTLHSFTYTIICGDRKTHEDTHQCNGHHQFHHSKSSISFHCYIFHVFEFIISVPEVKKAPVDAGAFLSIS